MLLKKAQNILNSVRLDKSFWIEVVNVTSVLVQLSIYCT